MKDQALKRDWVVALRSGRYRQGDSYLRQPARGGGEMWCCLGVLCDLLSLNPEDSDEYVKWGSDGTRAWWRDWESSTHLPGELGHLLGLDSVDQDMLVNLNDGGEEGRTDFDGIADWIEENL